MALFHSTSATLRAERVCQQAGIEVKLIPTPRQFSSDCGKALRFDWAKREQVEAVLQAARVDVTAFHRLP